MVSGTITYELDNKAGVRLPLAGSKEEALLKSAKAGDSSAFEALVMPRREALLEVTWRILRNQQDAEDAVQNALLDAFSNLNCFQERSRFSSWLTRVAMNAALMRLRINRRKRETSLDAVAKTFEGQSRFQIVEPKPDPEHEYLSKESRVLLERLLERLSPLYAEILDLRVARELSTTEAARLLEVPVGTVKARLHRARAELTRLRQRGPSPLRNRRVRIRTEDLAKAQGGAS